MEGHACPVKIIGRVWEYFFLNVALYFFTCRVGLNRVKLSRSTFFRYEVYEALYAGLIVVLLLLLLLLFHFDTIFHAITQCTCTETYFSPAEAQRFLKRVPMDFGHSSSGR